MVFRRGRKLHFLYQRTSRHGNPIPGAHARMQNNEPSHGSQPTQCGYRFVHRRLVLGSPISPVPSDPERRIVCRLGPSACRADSSGASGCEESDSEGRSSEPRGRRMGFQGFRDSKHRGRKSGIPRMGCGVSEPRGGSLVECREISSENVEVWHRLPEAPRRNKDQGCSHVVHFDSGRVAGCPPPSCCASCCPVR